MWLITVIKRRHQRQSQLPSHKPKLGTRRRLQYLCLDKAYHSKPEEQVLIKRGYVLHIPYKKRKERKLTKKRQKRYRIVKNILLKDGL
jgi:hypothetical protein